MGAEPTIGSNFCRLVVIVACEFRKLNASERNRQSAPDLMKDAIDKLDKKMHEMVRKQNQHTLKFKRKEYPIEEKYELILNREQSKDFILGG